MNLALALTAIRNGATCLNQVEVLSLLKKKIKIGEKPLLELRSSSEMFDNKVFRYKGDKIS